MSWLRLSFALVAIATAASAQVGTSVTLAPTPNPSTLGAAVTLTASVTPPAATGTITFYDGVTIVGIKTLVSGSAPISTKGLPSGARSLRAYYSGDGTYLPSISPRITQTVSAVAGNYLGLAGQANATGSSLAQADFNGDGKMDLAVVAGPSLMILLGNGDGTFALQPTINVGGILLFVAAGDFNGDGKVDLAIADFNGKVDILPGNGNGTFAPGISITGLLNPQSLLVGDFNGDGKADLAFADLYNINIALGKGDGTFQNVVTYPAGNLPSWVIAGDFNGDGKTDLAVLDDNAGSLLLGNGDGSFQAPVAFTTGPHPTWLVAADFNGDGKLDLAVANSNNINLLTGNGNGTFAAAGTIAASNINYIAAGDFNADGKVDLIAAPDGQQLGLLLGKGDGTFQAATLYGPVTSGIAAAVVGEFNGDGRADVAMLTDHTAVLVGQSLAPTALSISKTHSGSFTQGQNNATYQVTVSNAANALPSSGTITVTDTLPAGLTLVSMAGSGWTCNGSTCINPGPVPVGSSLPAITVTVNVAGNAAPQVTNQVSVSGGGSPSANGSDPTTVLQNQTITFNAIANHTYGDAPFNLDSTASSGLSVTYGATGNCTVLGVTLTITSTGSCSVTASQAGNSVYAPAANVTRNFNIVQATSSSTVLGASPNPSTFGIPATLVATITPSIATGKVTLYDGTTVLGTSTIASGSASLTTPLLPAGKRSLKARYNGDANFPASISTALVQTVNAVTGIGFTSAPQTAPGSYGYVVAADFNGDGKADLASGNAILIGNGSGGFTASLPTLPAGAPIVAAADFNADGKTDLALTDGVSSYIVLGNGDGTFQTTAKATLPLSMGAIADFNGDGKPDIVAININTPDFGVFLGNGDGTFGSKLPTSLVGGAITYVAAGDFNGDGKVDVALALSGDVNFNQPGHVVILLGKGDGTFQTTVTTYDHGFSPNYIVVTDLNGDGKADIIFTDDQTNDVSVLVGKGDGTFFAPVSYSSNSIFEPRSVAVSDFNGDGKLDLAVAYHFTDRVVTFAGSGDGSFQTGVPFTLPNFSFAYGIAAVDLNGDGRADLALASNVNANLILLTAKAPPLLSITKTHTGNFTPGQQNATYTVTVSNAAGATPTTSAVTVTDTIPAGLTLVSMSGTSWTCTTNSCSRSDVLNPAASYPAITVKVNVAANAPAQVTNQASVSGGGSASNAAGDVTAIGNPSLSISKTHSGSFSAGQQNAVYTVTVSNAANAPATSGTVTVTETIPTGLSLVSMAGTGWNCSTNACTRADALNGGASYPAITVTVNVAANAASQVTNQVSVSGGGSAAANASDPTTVTAVGLSIAKTHSGTFAQGQQNAIYGIVVSNAAGAAATSGTVTVTETVPTGLTLVSMSGTGWSCSTNTCTRTDALSGGASYPSITVTVNVAANAAAQVTNQASVSGGGSSGATASDPTSITPIAGPPHYSNTILDVPAGIASTCDTHAAAINNKGQVLGRYSCAAGNTTGIVVWTNGAGAVLPDPSGYQNSDAGSINNNGVVTGTAISKADGTQHAVQWTNGVPSVHVLVPGAKNDGGLVTNDGGDLLVATDSASSGAVVWVGSSPINLGSAGACLFSAFSMNDARQVAGRDCNNGLILQPGSNPVAFFSLINSANTFPTLSVQSINNLGHVAAVTSSIAVGLTMFTGSIFGGETVFSGPPPAKQIQGLNNLDQALVFNYSSTFPLQTTIEIFSKGTTYSVKELVAAPTNLISYAPPISNNALNDSGQIVLDEAFSCGAGCTMTRAAILTPSGTSTATMSLSRTSLNFATTGSLVTDPQNVTLTFTGGALGWTAASTQSNIKVTPASGTGNATLQISVTAGTSGVVTITAPGATNSPQQIQVNVASVATGGNPFGSFDTPTNNTSGISGAIAVTGWALDPVEVTNVDIWRERVGTEPVAPNGLVFIGNATLVVGARPDVESANPNTPFNYRAGWGYLLLTNFLPATGGGASGNGTYKLHAIAHSAAGASVDLGTKTITVDNAHASKPFGTIDTPDQGGSMSGSSFVNFGWALTQNPYCIPTDGSTITVTVDGVTLGHPVYNQFRTDIATAFPGLCNSQGAIGYLIIDSTKLTKGVHTIGWVVYDNQGRGDGIGSRLFSVFNTNGGSAIPDDPVQAAAQDLPDHVDLEELDRIELPVGAVSGYLDANKQRMSLPIGSTLKGGVFYWQLGPGFHGTYPLVFLRPDGSSVRVRVTVRPKTYRQSSVR